MPPMISIAKESGLTGPGVPGYPSWPQAVLPFEASMFAVHRPDIASWITAGRSDLRASLPLRERDPGLPSRIWTAQSLATTRVADPGVLGGLPRFAFGGVDPGLYAALDAPLTDYTVAMLARASNVTGAKWLFGVGFDGATRMGIYFNGDEVAVQHQTTNVVQTSNLDLVANAWLPVIVSYQNSNRALRIHTGGLAAAASATMVNSPPSGLGAAIGSVPNGNQPFAGEIALCALWRRPIHTDAAAMGRLVTALNGLAGL